MGSDQNIKENHAIDFSKCKFYLIYVTNIYLVAIGYYWVLMDSSKPCPYGVYFLVWGANNYAR